MADNGRPAWRNRFHLFPPISLLPCFMPLVKALDKHNAICGFISKGDKGENTGAWQKNRKIYQYVDFQLRNKKGKPMHSEQH